MYISWLQKKKKICINCKETISWEFEKQMVSQYVKYTSDFPRTVEDDFELNVYLYI